MNVDPSEVNINKRLDEDCKSEEQSQIEQQSQIMNQFQQAATQFLPTGAEVYKIIKYLDLATSIEIVLVRQHATI